ncbi:hypothetical protein MERGE_002530 [Pneumocystis wakefieldiae]|uniref:Uncharacterized protein n=1 Tax=Pneumocystis wakefieldiae TaxID=38082 RepID=A0A899FTW6_9ASCO|nr:hypothetical protein MERGE_002530 [Pneumocystis wakefieldiae]
MISKVEDRLKQEIVPLNIKKVENEILMNALRSGINKITLTLFQNNPLTSTCSMQYQSQNSGIYETSVPECCPGTQ